MILSSSGQLLHSPDGSHFAKMEVLQLCVTFFFVIGVLPNVILTDELTFCSPSLSTRCIGGVGAFLIETG